MPIDLDLSVDKLDAMIDQEQRDAVNLLNVLAAHLGYPPITPEATANKRMACFKLLDIVARLTCCDDDLKLEVPARMEKTAEDGTLWLYVEPVASFDDMPMYVEYAGMRFRRFTNEVGGVGYVQFDSEPCLVSATVDGDIVRESPGTGEPMEEVEELTDATDSA